MPITIQPLGPQQFAGEVHGIDLCESLSAADAAAIHAGMDEFAVLVFHGEALTPQQQLDFSKSLGELEITANVGLRAPQEYRLPDVFADISNLDKAAWRPTPVAFRPPGASTACRR